MKSFFKKNVPTAIVCIIIITPILIALKIVYQYGFRDEVLFQELTSQPSAPKLQSKPIQQPTHIPLFRTNSNPSEMTYTEKYLNDGKTFIVIEKQLFEGDKYLDSELWRTNLDGSNPQKLYIPKPHGSILNPIAHEWVYFLSRDKEIRFSTKILAFNLVNNKVTYISEEPVGQFVPVVGVPSISPDSETVIYNISYVDKTCELNQIKKKSQEGCPYIAEELKKLNPRTFAYNIMTDKKIELQLSPVYETMIGVWDETGENFYSESCRKVTNIKSGITYLNDVSPNCAVQSPNHKKNSIGITYINRRNNYEFKGWVSNENVLMTVQDRTSLKRGTYYFLYNVDTKNKKLLAPGDSYSFFEF